jgi:hypothetical protein
MSIEAMKQWLEALEDVGVLTIREWQAVHKNKANELRQAIADAEKQEPVAWRFQSSVGGWAYGKEPPIGSKYAVEPLYTTPQQRTWVGLTDEETAELVHRYAFYELTRQIEAKLKEKNNG